VLADGGAPAVLALAPASVVLADGGAPALLASAPLSVVLADGGAPTVLALVPQTVIDCRKPLHKCARASPTAPRTARCA